MHSCPSFAFYYPTVCKQGLNVPIEGKPSGLYFLNYNHHPRQPRVMPNYLKLQSHFSSLIIKNIYHLVQWDEDLTTINSEIAFPFFSHAQLAAKSLLKEASSYACIFIVIDTFLNSSKCINIWNSYLEKLKRRGTYWLQITGIFNIYIAFCYSKHVDTSILE